MFLEWKKKNLENFFINSNLRSFFLGKKNRFLEKKLQEISLKLVHLRAEFPWVWENFSSQVFLNFPSSREDKHSEIRLLGSPLIETIFTWFETRERAIQW